MTAAGNPETFGESVTDALPQVTETAALEDRTWFGEHAERRFRARVSDGGLWVVRRRPQAADPDVYLRAFSPIISPPRDSDTELAAVWFGTANPSWSPERVQKAARKALRKPRS
jgi:hypothetical protein